MTDTNSFQSDVALCFKQHREFREQIAELLAEVNRLRTTLEAVRMRYAGEHPRGHLNFAYDTKDILDEALGPGIGRGRKPEMQ